MLDSLCLIVLFIRLHHYLNVKSQITYTTLWMSDHFVLSACWNPDLITSSVLPLTSVFIWTEFISSHLNYWISLRKKDCGASQQSQLLVLHQLCSYSILWDEIILLLEIETVCPDSDHFIYGSRRVILTACMFNPHWINCKILTQSAGIISGYFGILCQWTEEIFGEDGSIW